jgi:hypothetical protein
MELADSIKMMSVDGMVDPGESQYETGQRRLVEDTIDGASEMTPEWSPRNDVTAPAGHSPGYVNCIVQTDFSGIARVLIPHKIEIVYSEMSYCHLQLPQYCNNTPRCREPLVSWLVLALGELYSQHDFQTRYAKNNHFWTTVYRVYE